MIIHEQHPRYGSLKIRHALVDGFKRGLVTEAGLIAHGRGEAFDYLLGERTNPFAERGLRAASYALRGAQKPVVSVNGNMAALAAGQIAGLQAAYPKLLVEVNLFYHSDDRANVIADYLRENGVQGPLVSLGARVEIEEVKSSRRYVNSAGIAQSDLVLLAIEDGDRTQALVNAGKQVIAIDLNPLSRTARVASISIIDEMTRTLARLIELASEPLSDADLSAYDHEAALREAEAAIRNSGVL